MNFLRHLKNTVLTAVSCSVIFCASCGPTLDEGADARIRVTPPRQVTFSRVTVGESRSLPFVVTSVGKDGLDVRRIEWTGSEAVTLSTNTEVPTELSSLASLPVSVEFKPTNDHPSPDGTIRIYTNDSVTPVYSLDVVSQQLAPRIHVSPSQEEKLFFGQTEVGEISTRKVIVTNTGDLPLIVNAITLNGPKSFKYEIEKNRHLPMELAPNATTALNLEVSFSPKDTGMAEGTIVFESTDPDTPRYALPIKANSNTPCMLVHPSLLEFSAVSVGGSQSRTVQLKSCSDVPLIVSEVLKNSGSDEFSYTLNDAGKELANGESASLEITYRPLVVGTAQASYTIINNDPQQPNALLTVMATASANRCPKAVARGRLSSSSNWEKTIDLSPLDNIILDGSLSTDEESSELKYYWSVNKHPDDSTSKITSEGSQASFFLDIAGEYQFCLNVEDTEGMMSCNTDCVNVTVTPKDTIHIQLVWYTPADKVFGDGEGTDLDLHFMTLSDGSWGDEGNPTLNNGTDVFFLNQSPKWVVQGQMTEEPRLDIDSKTGEKPENINLDHPAACRWYAIGVHYFQDNAFGLSYATVRVYLNGEMRFEKSNISLSQTGVFKQIAWMFWDGSKGWVFESDLAYSRDEDWIGITPAIPEEVMSKAKKYSPSCF